MITQLNKRQLAFILDIKVEDARAQMCVAWAALTRCKKQHFWNKAGRVVDNYPEFMDVPFLAAGLTIPLLQEAINDIHNNCLRRPAMRKYILSDLPEKQIEKNAKSGRNKKPQLPPALKSLISDKVKVEIMTYWSEKYPTLFPEYV